MAGLQRGVRPEIGRYFSDLLLETQKTLKALYELGKGEGSDVAEWIDGRELVLGRGEPNEGRGFIRLLPLEPIVVLAFPKGSQLLDPKKKLKGPAGSQLSMSLTSPYEVDSYVRRLVDTAYSLERS